MLQFSSAKYQTILSSKGTHLVANKLGSYYNECKISNMHQPALYMHILTYTYSDKHAFLYIYQYTYSKCKCIETFKCAIKEHNIIFNIIGTATCTVREYKYMGEWADGWVDGWMDGWVNGWMDGGMDWMEGWIGWTDGKIYRIKEDRIKKWTKKDREMEKEIHG